MKKDESLIIYLLDLFQLKILKMVKLSNKKSQQSYFLWLLNFLFCTIFKITVDYFNGYNYLKVTPTVSSKLVIVRTCLTPSCIHVFSFAFIFL